MTRTTDVLDLIRGAPIKEVPLDPTPLVRVVAQARFPQMGALLLEDAGEKLLRVMIGDGYPNYEAGFEQQFQLGPSGISQKDSSSKLWRFLSLDGKWIVTITPASIALETTDYMSRPDFIQRFGRVVNSFVATLGPPAINRLGVRYTNFYTSPNGDENDPDLVSFFRPDLRGPVNIADKWLGLQISLSDIAVHDAGRGLQAKWGVVPGGAIYDPTAPPTQRRTALLDIDSFAELPGPMDYKAAETEANSLAEAAYRLFRSVVSDDYIEKVRSSKG